MQLEEVWGATQNFYSLPRGKPTCPSPSQEKSLQGTDVG